MLNMALSRLPDARRTKCVLPDLSVSSQEYDSLFNWAIYNYFLEFYIFSHQIFNDSQLPCFVWLGLFKTTLTSISMYFVFAIYKYFELYHFHKQLHETVFKYLIRIFWSYDFAIIDGDHWSEVANWLAPTVRCIIWSRNDSYSI